MDEFVKDYFEFLKKLEHDPEFCFRYLKDNPGHEQCLQTISKSAEYSFKYSTLTSPSKRFELGEFAISKDPKFAYKYAKDVIKGKWEMGEDAISKNAEFAWSYAVDIIRGRWEKGEKAISKNAKFSYLYALDIIKGRFILGEDAIAKNSEACLSYAIKVIKGKLPDDMHNKMIGSVVAA